MAKKPLYIQLEPGAYPKDIDWQMMTAEERGCYHSLVIFIACSNGSIPNEPERLAVLCNINCAKLRKFLKKYSHKFIEKNGEFSHKRITEELAKSRKHIRQRSLAGKASAKSRSTAVQRSLNERPTGEQLSKVKESKVKKREEKLIKTKAKAKTLDFNSVPEPSFKKLFSDEFCPVNQYEINTLNKFAKACFQKQTTLPNVYLYLIDEIVDLKEHCKVKGKGHDDLMRMFIASIKKEFKIT